MEVPPSVPFVRAVRRNKGTDTTNFPLKKLG
jgi:hypothetical protein